MSKELMANLIKKSLRIKHKLKVFESSKIPDNHEELAAMNCTKWEYEDELIAIETRIQELRRENVQQFKDQLTLDELSHGSPSQRGLTRDVFVLGKSSQSG